MRLWTVPSHRYRRLSTRFMLRFIFDLTDHVGYHGLRTYITAMFHIYSWGIQLLHMATVNIFLSYYPAASFIIFLQLFQVDLIAQRTQKKEIDGLYDRLYLNKHSSWISQKYSTSCTQVSVTKPWKQLFTPTNTQTQGHLHRWQRDLLLGFTSGGQ